MADESLRFFVTTHMTFLSNFRVRSMEDLKAIVRCYQSVYLASVSQSMGLWARALSVWRSFGMCETRLPHPPSSFLSHHIPSHAHNEESSQHGEHRNQVLPLARTSRRASQPHLQTHGNLQNTSDYHDAHRPPSSDGSTTQRLNPYLQPPPFSQARIIHPRTSLQDRFGIVSGAWHQGARSSCSPV